MTSRFPTRRTRALPISFTSFPRWIPARVAAWTSGLLLIAGLCAPAHAQLGGGGAVPEAGKLVRPHAAPVTIAAGGKAEAVITIDIEPGWHVNANPPSPDYMIATAVELVAADGIQPGKPVYPAPIQEKVGFEESLLSVYNRQAIVRVPLVAAANAAGGAHTIKGSVRFQACNDQVCLAPSTVPVTLLVTVTGGATATSGGAATNADSNFGAAPETSAAALATTPPAPLAPLQTHVGQRDDLAAQVEKGGWLALFILFGFGLALNLTPCVYPMIGVTVAMFGARRAAPPLQVFGLAVLYVLGMAVMYTSLGVGAALTGGLFGGLLQNPFVSGGIGVLLVALSLPMFGVFEFQVPQGVLSRLGGSSTTGALGIFFSGLMVGVFAAPCVGPFVVSLLLLVGTKADLWFGFRTFFVLALGLGAPYLLLATFSNLIQRLPRSGEWMVWVKKVFGMILVALGAKYVLTAFAPGLSAWVVPVVLVAAGVYLGFLEMSGEKAARFRLFKRASGAVAALVGIIMVITTPSKSEGITFESFSDDTLRVALASGQPAMLDFTASWCGPCHELERLTFTDRRVRQKAREFRTFRVDLTSYNSPEAERWRRDYGITGVPTVVFLAPGGGEVRAARVVGFLPPQDFLERMHLASDDGPRAASD
jgi:thioredoxin:protein disulfide reductase